MIIIGVDFHPEFQQSAWLDTENGEFQEKRLMHREEAENFYRALAAAGQKVRVGMEASGFGRWFERLLAELQLELWIGDAAEIQSKRARKQKTDRQDAQHILKLMLKDDFPRIWVPSWENRDLRQLLWHRHRLVQARTRIMNQLQAKDVGPICERIARDIRNQYTLAYVPTNRKRDGTYRVIQVKASAPGRGHLSLAGHRDTFFRALRNVHNGDEITLETASGLHRYRADSILVVDPDDTQVLGKSNEAILTLVTCYPFSFLGPAPKRFIVRAHKLAVTAARPASADVMAREMR